MYQPSLIVIMSDLGSARPGLSALRALLLHTFPTIPVVELLQQRSDDFLPEPAYYLLSAKQHFPQGALYLLPYRLFTSGKSDLMVTVSGQDVFIGSDNGLIATAFGTDLGQSWINKTKQPPHNFQSWIAALHEVLGYYATSELVGLSDSLAHEGWQAHKPYFVSGIGDVFIRGDEIQCSLLSVDRFGNVVLNISKEQFETLVGDRSYRINTGGKTFQTAISHSYSDVAKGQPLCRFNDAGFLEIAVNGHSAAVKMNLDNLDGRDMYYKRVGIFLEDTNY